MTTLDTIDRTKAIGIPFRSDLVPKIMRDEKTQTRRIIIPQPPQYSHWDEAAKLFVLPGSALGVIRAPKYGSAGSILYVKEDTYLDDDGSWRYKADDASVDTDSDEAHLWLDAWYHGKRTPYRSTRYMPKWMARTFLEVRQWRVQPLGDIMPSDAREEGFQSDRLSSAREKFLAVWDQLHGTTVGHRVRDDPWVDAYTFSRLA